MAGRDANTGNQVDHFDCAVTWLPVLLIENAAMTRQTAAATESFRNEVVKRQDASAGAFDQRLAGPFVEKLR